MLKLYLYTDGKTYESKIKGDNKMRTRAMILLVAAMMISATTSVYAADSMKHDMQRDLHERMGMSANEEKLALPTPQTTKESYMKHDMQWDLHVNMGMAENDAKTSVTKFEAPTDPSIYRP